MSREPIRWGLVVPSSNTGVEDVLGHVLAGTTDVHAHVSRFPATALSLDPAAVAGFSAQALLDAAALLVDAGVSAIAYCGVSGAWLGIDRDIELCARITERLGVGATTASLATVAALRALGAQECALVKPGSEEIAGRVVDFLAAAGISCSAVVRIPAHDNLALGQLPRERLVAAITEAAGHAGVVCLMGTNLPAAPLVDELERELGVTIVDSTAATLYELGRMEPTPPRFEHRGTLLATSAR